MGKNKRSVGGRSRTLWIKGLYHKADQARYGQVLPKIRKIEKRIAKPRQGGTGNEGSLIVFDIKTASNEMMVPDKRPFIVDFKPRVTNLALKYPTNDAGVATTTPLTDFGDPTNPLDVAARPYLSGEIPYYISPLLGAVSFLTNPSVTLDNCQIQRPDINWHLYNALCYIFCTDEVRAEMFGQETEYPRSTLDLGYHEQHKGASTPAWHEYRISQRSALLQRMCFESLGCVEQHADYVKTARGNFAGLFPLCVQNATLRSHTGVRNDNLFLSAGSHVEVSVEKIKPLGALIERADERAHEYFIPDAAACPTGGVDQGRRAAYKSEISLHDVEVSFAYEVLELEQEIMDGAFKGLFDFPIQRINYVTPAVRHDTQTIAVPEHSRLFYLAFIPECQVNLSMRPGHRQHHLSTRFAFPENLERVRFKLTDSSDLIVKDGTFEMGSRRTRSKSHSLRMYFESLIEDNIYDGRWEDWCPQPHISFVDQTNEVQEQGFDQAFCVMLDKYPRFVSKPTELTVDLTWSANSPPNLYIYTWFVQQRMAVRNKSDGWRFQVIPITGGGGEDIA